MKEFATLLSNIENTSKTNTKVSYLKEYFKESFDQDRVWAIALFTHKRPRRQVNTRMLSDWANEKAKLPVWLFEESYHVVGDLSETLSLILPKVEKSEIDDQPLTFWIESLVQLEGKSDDEKKDFIFYAWEQMDRNEILYFNKLITGGFRVGVSKNLVIRALAEATDQEPSEIAHRLMGNWDPLTESFKSLVIESSQGEELSRPYPFYLAYPIESEISELGNPNEWNAEWKWDGIRSQLVKRGGELHVWSRGEELITDKFPELNPLKDVIPDGTVIDGELAAFKNGKILPFALLQTRISRKTVSKKQLKDAPAAIISYDLLEWKGEDFRNMSLEHRRNILNNLVNTVDHSNLHFSEDITFNTWQELSTIRESSRENFAEGLMIKRKKSDYKVGRKRGDWWKWKIDPYSIDAVLIYARKGHGRRADLYSDYTFAVWDQGKLVTFAKAYSGLTDKEMLEITRFVRANTQERFGPVRNVKPELVFEIHFEGIAPSSRHKSGVAVRFPRIHRWRRDKAPSEANTLEELKNLIHHP